MAELKFEITQKLGVIAQTAMGAKELNMVSWNDRPAKYDIRDWSEDYSQMSKGLTFTKEEMTSLKKLLNSLKDI